MLVLVPKEALIRISYGEKDIEWIAIEFEMEILAEDQLSQFSSSDRCRAR